MMRAKPFILEGKQHVEKARVDIGDRRRQAPAAFAGRVSAQQTAFAIDDPRREQKVFAQWSRTKRRDPPAKAGDGRDAN